MTQDVKVEVNPRFPLQQDRKIGIKLKEETCKLLHFEHKDKVKAKFTLKQAIAQRGGGVEVLLYPFLNLSARWGGWSTPRPGRFTPEKDPVPLE
jgi:hypothetical protein